MMRYFAPIIVALVFMVVAVAEGVRAFSLQGKTVLVTGSAGGIGKGIAKLLAEQGAKIIIHYHTREEEAKHFGDELGSETCLGVLHCDFRDISSIPAFFRKAKDLCLDQDSGKLDVLVNNAGAITKFALDSDDDTLKVWRDTMAVNLDAPNLLGKLFAEQFQREGESGSNDGDTCAEDISGEATTKGVILNVGSIHGDRSNEYMGAYAASKAALESLTRTMALEYALRGIRVNLIAPGIVPVERTERFFRDHPETLKGWTNRIPVGRAGSVEEVAQACLPLIENEWITGTVWQIDGGMMARANMPERPRP
jgi:NAD(P)-dependent dehydrogenase (short-subunit alcohol dehydrogenase family)